MANPQLLTFNYWPDRWINVPQSQLDNAKDALKPLSGTIMVEMQPEITESRGGIQLVQQRGARAHVSETWTMFPPNQPTAGTIVAVGPPLDQFVTKGELAESYEIAIKSGAPSHLVSPHLDDFAPLGLQVGDRVLVCYDHGNGFRGWYTPPYVLGPKLELKVFGRFHVQPDPDLPFADAFFVPLDMSIPAVIEGDSITPTGRNVLLEREILRDKSNSGLIELPNRVQTRSTIATVRAVGPRVRELKPGDRVVYSPAALRYWRGNSKAEILALAPEASILSKV